jgi:hypothetical protein
MPVRVGRGWLGSGAVLVPSGVVGTFLQHFKLGSMQVSSGTFAIHLYVLISHRPLERGRDLAGDDFFIITVQSRWFGIWSLHGYLKVFNICIEMQQAQTRSRTNSDIDYRVPVVIFFDTYNTSIE